MEFPDITALVAIARERGVTTALDNTWGAGLAFQPFALDQGDGSLAAVDISVQALTKYPSGGADVLMGSVTTRDEALHQRIKATHMRSGFGVAGNDCELVLRSLPSLPLRYEAQARAGLTLAQWWRERPEVAKVLHPALPGSPVQRCRWPVLCGVRRALPDAARRRLRRRAASFPNRLFVGRPDEPRRALRLDAPARCTFERGHAGALRARPRGCR